MPGIILLIIFMLSEDILRPFFYDKKIKMSKVAPLKIVSEKNEKIII